MTKLRPPSMIFLRSGVFAAAITLCSCSLSTAPEPPEFKLSAAALGKQYPASRKTGAVRLYAKEIKTTRDEWGRETHMASGGALLVKEAMTPIYALAPSISITPEFSEVLGKGTVKKGDRLYIGQDESTKIRIDGAAIVPEGAVATRGIIDEAAAAGARAQEEEKAKAKEEAKAKAEAKAVADAEAKAKEEVEAKAKAEVKAKAKADKALADAETKAKKEAEAQAKAAARADAKAKEEAEAKAVAAAKKEAAAKALADKERVREEAEAKAVAEKAKAKADAEMKVTAYAKAEKAKSEARAQAKTAEEPPAKPKAASTAAKKSSDSAQPKAKIATASKPKSTPATPAKAAPVVDRARLLQLMREPTVR